MPKAVQLSAYGGVDQLQIVDRPKPEPQAGEVVVRVVAAGLNPGEISIREGLLKEMFPMDFPFGQGSDFAGRIDAVGAGVTGFAVGDEVLGFTDHRAAHAEYVVSGPENLLAKPPSLDWFRAGSLFVVATTAVAAVRAVSLQPGDVVAISGAAGGVGSLAMQLAVRANARVIGIAGEDSASFLRSVDVEPVAYGDGLEERLRALAPAGISAFIDLFGDGYVELAVKLGVARDRINTIIDFAGAKTYGVKSDGSAAATSLETLSSVADAVAWGELIMPLTAIYPFASVRDAYTQLARRKTRGKIVLAFDPAITGPLRPLAPGQRLVRHLYDRFNARDIDGVLAALDQDVTWANGMDGGHERGREAVRAYWTRQWAVIDPHVDPLDVTEAADGSILVRVHQVVKNLEGTVVLDETIAHRFHVVGDVVTRFDIEGASELSGIPH